MTQDILDELLQTEKAAAGLIASAERDAACLARETEQKILGLQAELKQELKQNKLALQEELKTLYAKEAVQAAQKTRTQLAGLAVSKDTLAEAAAFLTEKILA
ncbi:MAG: hypothetical protein LBJ25_05840 [Candidatus Margulisbacteria bacterium]|jgi:hypothetical protein|nr:hypothetical protein [Candidatus Margulisiibacteriota bacterium]